MLDYLDDFDKAVVKKMIAFVEDRKEGYGHRVDGTEDRILDAFCAMGRRALGLPAGEYDEEPNDDPAIDELEQIGAVSYAWQIISPNWFDWCQIGNKHRPDVSYTLIESRCEEWNDRFENNVNRAESRWDTEWC